jgi:hypothetical protein
MVVHDCNPNTREIRAEGSQVQGQPASRVLKKRKDTEISSTDKVIDKIHYPFIIKIYQISNKRDLFQHDMFQLTFLTTNILDSENVLPLRLETGTSIVLTTTIRGGKK